MGLIVSLNKTANSQVTFEYSTSDGSTNAQDDYVATSAMATVPSGQQFTTVNIPIVSDGDDEEDEFFTGTISNPSSNARINEAAATGAVTIVDDNAQADLSVTKDDSPTQWWLVTL